MCTIFSKWIKYKYPWYLQDVFNYTFRQRRGDHCLHSSVDIYEAVLRPGQDMVQVFAFSDDVLKQLIHN